MTEEPFEIDSAEPEPGVPAVRKQATPVKYSPALAERILLKVADGMTLREIAAEPGMPTKSTIQRWIMKLPELATAWKAARELSASSLEEEALDMARTLRKQSDFTGTKVRAFDVAMNQFRWSAAHRDPQQFGQTTQPSITVPIQINTSLDLADADGKATRTEVTTGGTTYEVAAKINSAYTDDQNAQIEGTDYTMEPGQGAEPREADRPDLPDRPDPGPLAPEAPQPVRLSGRKPGRPLGSRKGHRKSPQKVKEAQTKYARKLAKLAKETE